jgi:hypothetical protein
MFDVTYLRSRAKFVHGLPFRPNGSVTAIGAAVSVLVTGLALWRDEFPGKPQPPYLAEILGWFPWWTWVIAALVVASWALVEGAFQKVEAVQAEVDAGLQSLADIAGSVQGHLECKPVFDSHLALSSTKLTNKAVLDGTIDLGFSLTNHSNAPVGYCVVSHVIESPQTGKSASETRGSLTTIAPSSEGQWWFPRLAIIDGGNLPVSMTMAFTLEYFNVKSRRTRVFRLSRCYELVLSPQEILKGHAIHADDAILLKEVNPRWRVAREEDVELSLLPWPA